MSDCIDCKKSQIEALSERPDSLGGIITSRVCADLGTRKKSGVPRFKIQKTLCSEFPKFENCPDWVKPLMYQEYQVFLK